MPLTEGRGSKDDARRGTHDGRFVAAFVFLVSLVLAGVSYFRFMDTRVRDNSCLNDSLQKRKR